jgi:anaerobic ribonucleoside-triphosphate reductase
MALKVRTSHDTIEEFNRNKIVKALVNEANAPIKIAEKIATEVENYLERIEVYPTTTMIREMVNAKLIEYGFDDIAVEHQRIGLPVFDVNRILTRGERIDSSTQFNPESIHKHLGDIIARSYALSSVIPPELADAHRRGLIHIHELEYFVTRPYCFVHDLRYFLASGLKVDGLGRDTAVAGPAKHPEVAIFHAAKALAASQVFWSGGQSYNAFNVFIAPYFVGRSERETAQLCQMFIYEMSQQYVARGGQMVLSSVSLVPRVPEAFADIPAVKPGGVVGPETYSDYEDEVRAVFRGVMDVMGRGDFAGKPFPFPQIEVRMDPGVLVEAEEDYLVACEISSKFGLPIFLNGGSEGIGDCSCSVESRLIADGSSGYPENVRGGILQEVTLNLPRIAFESGGREGRFADLLEERTQMAREILLLKMRLTESRMKEGSLGFASQSVGASKYLEVGNQALLIGVLGLNEAAKSLTGEELHESEESRSTSLGILRQLRNLVQGYVHETGLPFGLCESSSEEAPSRLATIDRRQFRGRFVARGDSETQSLHYSNGVQLRSSADVSLEERIEYEGGFHPLLDGGAMLNIWLGDGPGADVLWRIARRIADTDVALFSFTRDLSVCLGCGLLANGLVDRCEGCGSGRVDWISRGLGRISRVGVGESIGGWSTGAREQLLSRRRYVL